jgi:hypothetical protein
MKKYLLGLALVAAMVFGTSTVVAGTPVKKAAKTEQTTSVKKDNAKKAVAKKGDKKLKKAVKFTAPVVKKDAKKVENSSKKASAAKASVAKKIAK